MMNDDLELIAAELRATWAGRDWVEQPLEVSCYGGGVQSSAMGLMVKAGELPTPDLWLFSNTMAEMPTTLKHTEDRFIPLAEELGVPFVTVSAQTTGGYSEVLEPGEGIVEYSMKSRTLPMIGMRSCTGNFKILPQRRFVRAIVGPQNGVVLARFWLGISHDERDRARYADDASNTPKWCEMVFPLLEEGREITRADCRSVLDAAGWGDVEKSGCFMCCYQTLRGWVRLKAEYPDLWAQAVELEAVFKRSRPERRRGLYRRWLRDALPEVTLADFGFFDDDELDAPPLNHLGRPAPACDEPGGGCFL